MKEYKYQIHVHTAPCSACGRMTPSELCRALYENGYQGTVITNHFYHGNSGIDRSEATSWEEFVSEYEKDYLLCVEEAKKFDLDIIFGIEEGVFPGIEILCYGITPEILYKNPQLRNCCFEDLIKTMRENGVVVIQPHPFREADYIPEPRRLPLEYIDGIEIYNGGNSREEMNDKAVEFANEHPSLIKTSSADAHTPDRVAIGGIKTRVRIKTPAELAKILKNGDFEPILNQKTEE